MPKLMRGDSWKFLSRRLACLRDLLLALGISLGPHGAEALVEHHYEVAAYYVGTNTKFLGPLEEALQQVPGVYLTTQLWGGGAIATPPRPAPETS